MCGVFVVCLYACVSKYFKKLQSILKTPRKPVLLINYIFLINPSSFFIIFVVYVFFVFLNAPCVLIVNRVCTHPHSLRTNVQLFSETGQMIELLCEYLSACCIGYLFFIMPPTLLKGIYTM